MRLTDQEEELVLAALARLMTDEVLRNPTEDSRLGAEAEALWERLTRARRERRAA